MFHVESFWYRPNEAEDEKTSLGESLIAVSYTHLTLPTSDLV